MRIRRVLISIVLATGLAVSATPALTAPANAAPCRPVSATKTVQGEISGVRSYAQYHTHRLVLSGYRCGDRITLTGYQVGYTIKRPELLNCPKVRKITYNVGPLFGFNPAPVSITCKTTGNSKYVNVANRTATAGRGDQSAGASIESDLVRLVNKHHSIPQATLR